MLSVQCTKNHFEVVALVQARDDDNLDKNFRMFETTGHLERLLEGPTLFDERDRIHLKILLQLTLQPLQYLVGTSLFLIPNNTAILARMCKLPNQSGKPRGPLGTCWETVERPEPLLSTCSLSLQLAAHRVQHHFNTFLELMA